MSRADGRSERQWGVPAMRSTRRLGDRSGVRAAVAAAKMDGGAAAEGEAAVMATLVTSSMSSPLCLTWVTTGRASRH